MRAAKVTVTSLVLFGVTLISLLIVPSSAVSILVNLPFLLAILAFALIALFAAVRGSGDDRWVDRVPLLLVPPLAAFTLWSLSAPGAYFFAAAVSLLVWLAFGVLLITRMIALLARQPVRRDLLAVWTGALFVGLLVFAAGVSDVPLEVRFALSEDAMNDTALAVANGSKDPATIDRIGLWNVDGAERLGDGMRFTVEDAGFWEGVGFAYEPNGLPPVLRDESYDHWRGQWYIWTSR